IGGLDRWRTRLDALEEKLRLDLDAAVASDEAVAARVQKNLADLAALRTFALPLLERLAALPGRAKWGAWIDELSALATSALRRPDRVLSVLAELAPMASVGPVDLAEVLLVLTRRLTELVRSETGAREGKIFVAPAFAARGLSFDVVFVPGLAE